MACNTAFQRTALTLGYFILNPFVEINTRNVKFIWFQSMPTFSLFVLLLLGIVEAFNARTTTTCKVLVGLRNLDSTSFDFGVSDVLIQILASAII